MKSFASMLVSLVLIAVISMPIAAQEKKKGKGKKQPGRTGAAVLVLKKLEKAELTEEQTAKIKAMAAEVQKDLAAAREKAALTDEQKAAMKKAREAGKKGPEVQAEAGLSDEQKAAMKEAQEIQMQLLRKALDLLTPEQKEKAEIKLPGKKQGGQKKGGGKKKAAE